MTEGPGVLVLGQPWVELVEVGPATFEARPAGRALAVASSLVVRGAEVGLVAPLADDPLGAVLRRAAERLGVDVSGCPRTPRPSALTLVSRSDGGEQRYEYLIEEGPLAGPDREGLVPVDPPRVVDVVAGAQQGWDHALLEAVRRWAADGVVVVYQPEVRPELIADLAGARRSVEGWVGLAAVVVADVADLAWLYPGWSVDDVAGVWLRAGASVVVLTEPETRVHAWTAHGATAGVPASGSVADVAARVCARLAVGRYDPAALRSLEPAGVAALVGEGQVETSVPRHR